MEQPGRESEFKKWWIDGGPTHLIGKDILTTHSVYWSTMLKALELAPPRTIFAHGWWTVEGEKMSKSRGNVVDPNAMIDEFGADAFRYFLLREVPFGHDGDFSREAMIGRINTDLANDVGNLLNRTLTLIERFAAGKIPVPVEAQTLPLDQSLQQKASSLPGAVLDLCLTDVALNKALESIWEVVQAGNQYIDKSAPWTLAKKPEDKERLQTVLYHAAETLRFLASVLSAFMPKAADEMTRQLGAPRETSEPLLLTDLRWGGLTPGTEIAKGRPLFPRIEPPRTQGETRVTDQPSAQPTTATSPGSTGPQTAAQPAAAAVPQITIEDFQKIQLKTATVLAAERVPRSDKLLKLQVDLGTEQRQIVAGIGKKYEPEVLVGRRIVIVANLKPAKLMGIESQGMVLAAGDKDVVGLVALLEDVLPGTKVK
jgi:methionyl-tRNA synthetase